MHLKRTSALLFKGFTLIEVLASVVIIGLAFVSVLSLFKYVILSHRFCGEQVMATHLVQAKLEDIIAGNYTNDANETEMSYPGFPEVMFNVTEERPYAKTAAQGLGLKKVTVTAWWDTALGLHTETYTQLIAE